MKKLIIYFLFLNIPYCFSQSGWVYQPLPINANSYDMKFFDANTGVISIQYIGIYRTTNGGQNWIYILPNQIIFDFEIIDSNTVYGRGGSADAYGMIFRSFNKGLTWDSFYVSNSWTANGMSFVNKDTGWISGTSGGSPFVWRTTNQGINFIAQASGFGMGKAYFLKYKINGEYYGWVSHYNSMYKTTNSGVNWFLVGPAGNLKQLNMIDTSTGWASNGSVNILKTTNGGLNWMNLPMPSGNNILLRNIERFKIVSFNKIYGVGGNRWFSGSGKITGIIWATTNGGMTWGFQQPDTTNPNGKYEVIDFVDSLIGWCDYIHTMDGGGIITKITNNNKQITDNYILYQNYPNPFNPVTNFKYQIANNKFVTLKVFDILGKEVATPVNEKQQPGTYEVKFDGGNMPSGVYYYVLYADGVRAETRKMALIK
jgi:photosystem II stability/assembly factor-like uncharacterized protein